MKHRFRIIFLCHLAMLCGVGVSIRMNATAAVPTQMSFQGKVLDTSNNPVTSPTDFVFSLYDASSGGTQLWTETQNNVAVSNGVFSVQLGSVTPLPASVFTNDDAVYLQIQIEGETASSRERLLSAPYAFKAHTAENLEAGSNNYIQNSNTLQSGATFYVSSGSVAGSFTVGGVLVAGSAGHQITTSAGLLDATKLTGTLSSDRLSGTYSKNLVFSSTSNVFVGDGSGLEEVVARHLLPGDTNYIQNSNSLQSGATFYVSSATVAGSFAALGSVILGTTADATDVTVRSNLIVQGTGPHAFTGDIKVGGNDLLDSGGTSRFSLGSNIVVNGNLTGGAGQYGLYSSTSVVLTGTANGDNFMAFPFTAGGTITNRDIVVISGANTVDRTTTAGHAGVLGIAVNGAESGQTVYVAIAGIVTNVVANAAITAGTGRICTTTVAGRVASCNTNGAVLGKALSGTTGAGQTISVVITQGY